MILVPGSWFNPLWVEPEWLPGSFAGSGLRSDVWVAVLFTFWVILCGYTHGTVFDYVNILPILTNSD